MRSAEINYTTMRIRMDFLFRVMLQVFKRNIKAGIPQELAEGDMAGLVAIGCSMIHRHRADDGFMISETEQQLGLKAYHLVVERFMAIINKSRETSGLPITLSLGREEIYIREGIDSLIEELKALYGAEELNKATS